MKKKIIILPIVISFAIFGCKKNSTPINTSALTIVNAVEGSQSLVTNFSGSNNSKSQTFQWYGTALQISYGTYSELSSYSGNVSLSLSSINDTLNTIWNGAFTLPIGSIHTLFITGVSDQNSTKIDTLLTSDLIPFYKLQDSVVGFRFANLSPDTRSISVDLNGVQIAANLDYRTITAFQSFAADINNQANGYLFEFKDAVSGDVLATYTPDAIVLGKSLTLAFYGTSIGGQSVIAINNY